MFVRFAVMGRYRSKPVVVDIFCGCGGLSEGFKQAGFLPVLGIDIDEYAVATYGRHNDGCGWVADVTNVGGKDIIERAGRKIIDVMAGGPPCQAFSTVAVCKVAVAGHAQYPKPPSKTSCTKNSCA